MKRSTQEKPTRWGQVLSWITTKDKAEQSRKAIILQVTLATATVATVLYVIVYQFISNTPPTNALWSLITLIILYAVSRTRFHHVAAISVIVILLSVQFVYLIPGIAISNSTNLIISPVFSVPLVLLLFEGRTKRWLVLAAGLITVVSMWFWITQTSLIDPAIGLTIIVTVIGMVIFFPIAHTFTEISDVPRTDQEQVMNVLPDMVMIAMKGNVTYINPAGIRLLRADDASEIIGKALDDIILDQEDLNTSSGRHISQSGHLGKPVLQSVETLLRIDGERLRAMVTVTPIEQNGEMGTLLTAKPMPMNADIASIQNLIDSMSAIIYVGLEGRIVYISEAFERLLGYTREEVFANQNNARQMIHKDDRESFSAWIRALTDGDKMSSDFEYRLIRHDGEIIWVRSTPRYIRFQDKPAILFTLIDITPYKKAQSLLQAMPYPTLHIQRVKSAWIIQNAEPGKTEWFDDVDTIIGQSVKSVLNNVPLSSVDQSLPPQRDILTLGQGNQLPVEWTLHTLTSSDALLILRSVAYEEQLETDVKRFRTLFDTINDYAYILARRKDDQYEFIWTSHAFASMTGYDSSLDDTQTILDNLVHPDDRYIVEMHFEQLQRGEFAISEYRIVSKTGMIRRVREYAYPDMHDDELALIYGTVSDLTATMIAEETMKSYAMQQAVLAEVGMIAVENRLGIDEFAQQAIRLVVQLMDIKWCMLMAYHATDNRFSVFAKLVESGDEQIDSVSDDNTSYLDYVLQQNDPVLVQDWSTESRFERPQAYIDLGIRSTLSVIVPLQDQPFGILNIHADTMRQFSADHINMLQMVANIIGTYIQQRQTQEAEREHHLMAEALTDIASALNSATELQEVLRMILDFVAQLVPVVDSSNVMLLDADGQTVTITTRHIVSADIPYTPAGQTYKIGEMPIFVNIVEAGKPTVIDDVTQKEGWLVAPGSEWIKSYLGAPIFAGDDCIGIVNLDSAKLNAFTDEHLQQLEVFLNHASIAIQNARHREMLALEVTKRTQELQSERAQLQAFFDASGEGIFYSLDYDMLFVNNQLCEMMGYAGRELIGQSSMMLRPDDLTEGEVKARQRVNDTLRRDGMARGELRFRRKDGSTFIGAVTASRVRRDDDKFFAVTIIRDISEDLAIQAQRESFIAYASHELRNPISALSTRSYLMRKKAEKGQFDLDDVNKLVQVINKMNALVSGLLELSRFEHGQIPLTFQSIILQEVISEVRDIQTPEADKKSLTLSFLVPDAPMLMIADELRIYQVLTNLVTNAIHYTPDGGQIKVILRADIDTDFDILIEVHDTGIGIPAEKLSQLFQPFFRVNENQKAPGTGLGLSISKQIVEAHGGEISVKSKPNEGTCFIVRLPSDASTA